MAHFAQLDENNKVVNVLVVSNDDTQNLPFPESEEVGVAFLNSFLPPAAYKQTSFNHNFRVRYAGIGYTFMPELGEHGAFVPPKPYDYFVLDVEKCEWVPDVPYPTDGFDYAWRHDIRSWVKLPSLTVIG